MSSRILSVSQNWKYLLLPYFIKGSQIKGIDIDYIMDKEAWDNFCFKVKNRIATTHFSINWDKFHFKADTTYNVYFRAKALYHELPTCLEKMFEFGVMKKHKDIPEALLYSFKEESLTNCGDELWYKWDLTKNRWYIYRIGDISPEKSKTIFLAKIHKEMDSFLIDSAWLLEKGKDKWTPPVNWYKNNYDDSSWEKTNWSSISIDHGVSKIILLRQNIVVPKTWKDKGYLFLKGRFTINDIVYLNGKELYKVKEGYLIPPFIINYGGKNLLAIELYDESTIRNPSVRIHLKDYPSLPAWIKGKGVKKASFGKYQIIAKIQRKTITDKQLSRIDFVIIDKGKNNPALTPVIKCEEKDFPIAPAKDTGYFTAYAGYTEAGKYKIKAGIKDGFEEITAALTMIEVTKAPKQVNNFIFGSYWWDSFKLMPNSMFPTTNPYINTPEGVEDYYQKAFKLLNDCGMNTINFPNEQCCQLDKIARFSKKYNIRVIAPISKYIDTVSTPLQVNPREIYTQYEKMVNGLRDKKIPVLAYMLGDELSLASAKHSFWYLKGILQDIDSKPVVNDFNYVLVDSFKVTGEDVIIIGRRSSLRAGEAADKAGVVLWQYIDTSRTDHYDPYCAEAIRLKSYLAIAHGAKGIIYWCGISYNFSPHHTGTSFIDGRANPTDFYKKIAAEVGNKIKKLGNLFMGLNKEEDIAKSSDIMATVTTRSDGKNKYIFIVNEDLNSKRKIPIIPAVSERGNFKKNPILTDIMTGKRISVRREDFTFDIEIGPADMRVLKVGRRRCLT